MSCVIQVKLPNGRKEERVCNHILLDGKRMEVPDHVASVAMDCGYVGELVSGSPRKLGTETSVRLIGSDTLKQRVTLDSVPMISENTWLQVVYEPDALRTNIIEGKIDGELYPLLIILRHAYPLGLAEIVAAEDGTPTVAITSYRSGVQDAIMLRWGSITG